MFDTCSFDRCAQEELANVEFDDLYKTPLHIAIAVGSTELVELLVAMGAQPHSHFDSCLPWERYAVDPRLFRPCGHATMHTCILSTHTSNRTTSHNQPHQHHATPARGGAQRRRIRKVCRSEPPLHDSPGTVDLSKCAATTSSNHTSSRPECHPVDQLGKRKIHMVVGITPEQEGYPQGS